MIVQAFQLIIFKQPFLKLLREIWFFQQFIYYSLCHIICLVFKKNIMSITKLIISEKKNKKATISWCDINF